MLLLCYLVRNLPTSPAPLVQGITRYTVTFTRPSTGATSGPEQRVATTSSSVSEYIWAHTFDTKIHFSSNVDTVKFLVRALVKFYVKLYQYSHDALPRKRSRSCLSGGGRRLGRERGASLHHFDVCPRVLLYHQTCAALRPRYNCMTMPHKEAPDHLHSPQREYQRRYAPS